MTIVAGILADLEVTPIGTRSRLADELYGVTVLRRTVECVRRARKLDRVYVLCPNSQKERCSALIEGTGAHVRPFTAEGPPWAALVRTARKWSLDSWRGGIGGATCFDEFTDGRILSVLAKSVGAEAVLSVPPAAVVIDPDLIDRMIDHHAATKSESRLTFTQAPPGLSGLVLSADLLHELAEKQIPIGWVFSYKPDAPQKDLIFQRSCFEVPPEVRYAAGRLIADTARSMGMLQALLEAHRDPDARTAGRWLMERERTHVEPLPREVEIELTTDDPYPDALLRPRGERLGRQAIIESEIVEQVVRELAEWDDSLVVLGGFGDPLRHPDFDGLLRRIREATDAASPRGIYGLCVRTSGVDLTDDRIDTLIHTGVDMLSVTLDAWAPALYQRLQSPDGTRGADLGTVLGNLDRLAEAKQRRKTVQPIVIPELGKARENLHEMDDFHDGWLRKLGAVCISGVGHYASQFDDHRVMSMAPPKRQPCRRLRSRCLILADGRVTACDQDFRGKHSVGRIGENTLADIWNGPVLQTLRTAHHADRFDAHPLCAACDEWHRP